MQKQSPVFYGLCARLFHLAVTWKIKLVPSLCAKLIWLVAGCSYIFTGHMWERYKSHQWPWYNWDNPGWYYFKTAWILCIFLDIYKILPGTWMMEMMIYTNNSFTITPHRMQRSSKKNLFTNSGNDPWFCIDNKTMIFNREGESSYLFQALAATLFSLPQLRPAGHFPFMYDSWQELFSMASDTCRSETVHTYKES